MRPLAFAALAFATAAAGHASDFDAALGLYKERRYPEARIALEKIVVAEPKNASACYHLGMTLRRRSDEKALADALPWLEKATQLEPSNAVYLADYGGTALLFAAQNTSLNVALKGRDAMEKSLRLDPTNVDVRLGLMQFYERAPWPVGSNAKAAAQLEEIRKLNPALATVWSVNLKANAKDYAGAFKICEDLLAKNPADYTALYQYGRTAAVSGQNLPKGLGRLQQCAALPEPGSPAPTHSDVWNRIGHIREQLAQPTEARAAYETALKLNPANRTAAAALQKLK